MQIALPRELDPARRQELAREATRELLGDRFAYTLAVHVPLAMNSKACRLTVLGEHYRLLIAKADLMRPCCRTPRQSSRSDAKLSPGKRVRNFWRSSKLSKVSRTPIFRFVIEITPWSRARDCRTHARACSEFACCPARAFPARIRAPWRTVAEPGIALPATPACRAAVFGISPAHRFLVYRRSVRTAH